MEGWKGARSVLSLWVSVSGKIFETHITRLLWGGGGAGVVCVCVFVCEGQEVVFGVRLWCMCFVCAGVCACFRLRPCLSAHRLTCGKSSVRKCIGSLQTTDLHAPPITSGTYGWMAANANTTGFDVQCPV